jgi:hypothetical protein
MRDEIIDEIESVQDDLVDIKRKILDIIRTYDIDMMHDKTIRMLLTLAINEIDNSNLLLASSIRLLRKTKRGPIMENIRNLEEEEGEGEGLEVI